MDLVKKNRKKYSQMDLPIDSARPVKIKNIISNLLTVTPSLVHQAHFAISKIGKKKRDNLALIKEDLKRKYQTADIKAKNYGYKP